MVTEKLPPRTFPSLFIYPQISGTPRIHPLFLYAEKLGTHNGGKSKRAQRLAMDLGVAFLPIYARP